VDFAASGINDNKPGWGHFWPARKMKLWMPSRSTFLSKRNLRLPEQRGKRVRHVEYEIQYRVYGSGSGWTSKQGVYALKNINGLGFTERFDLTLRAGGGSMPPP
jgi:hypothetical protein